MHCIIHGLQAECCMLHRSTILPFFSLFLLPYDKGFPVVYKHTPSVQFTSIILCSHCNNICRYLSLCGLTSTSSSLVDHHQDSIPLCSWYRPSWSPLASFPPASLVGREWCQPPSLLPVCLTGRILHPPSSFFLACLACRVRLINCCIANLCTLNCLSGWTG